MDKKEFIAIFGTTLVDADPDVTAPELLDNGKREVNIEADSYGAIIIDVMKHCL